MLRLDDKVWQMTHQTKENLSENQNINLFPP